MGEGGVYEVEFWVIVFLEVEYLGFVRYLGNFFSLSCDYFVVN